MFDTHAHLTNPRISGDINNVVARAKKAGVKSIICVCDDAAGLDAAKTYEKIAYKSGITLRYSLGVHPHNAKDWDNSRIDAMLCSQQNSIAAVGEIGLDYHYLLSPKDTQITVFHQQLCIASEHGKPVIIHSRNAMNDTLNVIREYPGITGVFHCFSGTVTDMNTILSLGFYISIPGTVTFKVSHGKPADVIDVAAAVPIDRLLVETDCPYLAPVPHRGEVNEPAFIRHTLEFIAGLRRIDVQKLDEITTRNAERLFMPAKPDQEPG